MAKDWKLYAFHILDCIKKIRIIEKRGNILKDSILYDAAIRNLQTLSESTMHFPVCIKNEYPDVNWKAIKGFRNILVHAYLGEIDNAIVKEIITESLPALEKAIKEILCK